MNDSETTSQAFWQQVPHGELPEFTTSARTESEVAFLGRFLQPKDRILDLGCGWGRVASALADRGYAVNGLDLSTNLVTYGRQLAAANRLQVEFAVGSMLDLPYQAVWFSKIICMWGVFNHLLTSREQNRALREMYRVLRPGGAALIEMGNGESARYQRIRENAGYGPENRIWKSQFKPGPPPNVLYLHDRVSLRRLAGMSPFEKFRVVFQNIHYKRRIVTFLHKVSR